MNERLQKAIRFCFYALVLFLPFSTSGSQIALGALILLTLVRSIIERRLPRPSGPVGWLIVAMVAWVLLAAPFSLDFSTTAPRLAKYWIWLTYFVSLAALNSRETAQRAVKILVISAGVTAIYAIAQHFFGDAVPRFLVPQVKLWQKTGGYYHSVALFDHHLTYGNNLIVILLLGLGLWFAVQGLKDRLIIGAALTLGMLGLLWSYARSAWVGLIAGLMLFAGLKGKKALFSALIAVVVAGTLAASLSPTLAGRLRRAVTSSSNLERIYTWKTTLDMIADHPLTGIGPGVYRSLTDSYRAGYNINWTAKSHAHNSYLQIAAESGIVAGLLFTAILAVLFVFGLSRHRDITSNTTQRHLLAGAVGACTAFAVSSLLQHNAGDAEVCMVFQVAAAILVYLATETGDDP